MRTIAILFVSLVASAQTPPQVIRTTNVVIAEPSPLAAQLRKIVREERAQGAPWHQRFRAVKVVTNYVVTYAPIASGTNAPSAKTFKLETIKPTKQGDELVTFPDL